MRDRGKQRGPVAPPQACQLLIPDRRHGKADKLEAGARAVGGHLLQALLQGGVLLPLGLVLQHLEHLCEVTQAQRQVIIQALRLRHLG